MREYSKMPSPKHIGMSSATIKAKPCGCFAALTPALGSCPRQSMADGDGMASSTSGSRMADKNSIFNSNT